MNITKPIPPEMVAQIALGMEEPVDIAYRYGFAASEYRELEQHKPFISDVMAKRAELERGGQTVKVKAAWMTENLLDDLFLKAKAPEASIAQVQETVRIMAKLGDLEPKQRIEANQGGPAFQVVINIPAVSAGPQGSTSAQQVSLTFPSFTQDVTDVIENSDVAIAAPSLHSDESEPDSDDKTD